jgi:hypothetical protein
VIAITIERIEASGDRLPGAEEVVEKAVMAHTDARGTRWSLGAWGSMNTATIGRQASSRGTRDALHPAARVVITVGECGFCQAFAGEYSAEDAPWPPFHPSCTCTASAL